MLVPAFGGGCNNGLLWLTESGTQQWPTLNEAETPEYPWQKVEKGIQGLREIGIWKWIYRL